MTNAQIIEAARLTLILEGKIGKRDVIHTFAHWKALGYAVRKGEHAVSKFSIWKYKARRTTAEDGTEIDTGRMFPTTAAFFSSAQVDPI